MSLSHAERQDRIDRYARGPARLKAALGRVPEEARKWRPGPKKWSVHEVVCHCADSELNAAARIRYLVAEKDPVIVGYDQAEWAKRFDYHQHPIETALQTVEAVRANTVALLRHLPADAWSREGRHTETGRYAVDDWLNSYGEHLEKHSGQIERNLEAWKATRGRSGA